MSFFDKARKGLTGAVDKHGDKIGEGIDKAADMIDKRTGGKHAGEVSTGAEKAKEALDRLDGRDDDIPRGDGKHRGEPR